MRHGSASECCDALMLWMLGAGAIAGLSGN
jgi:hypothetical protein